MFTTCALFASRKLLQLCSCNDMNGSCDVKAFGFQEKVDTSPRFTCRVHVKRLGMLYPCGLPEGETVSHLHKRKTSLASIVCRCNHRLRQSEEPVTIARDVAPIPVQACTRSVCMRVLSEPLGVQKRAFQSSPVWSLELTLAMELSDQH